MSFLLPSLAGAAVVLLLVAGGHHLRRRRDLRRALDRQALLPRRARGLVAATLGPVEVLAGAAAATALVTDRAALVTGAGVTVTIAGLGFLATVGLLLRRHPTAPCGCGRHGDHPTHPAALARAGLVAAGGLALLAGAAGDLAALAPTERLTVGAAAVALALAADGLAAALTVPRPLPDGGIHP